MASLAWSGSRPHHACENVFINQSGRIALDIFLVVMYDGNAIVAPAEAHPFSRERPGTGLVAELAVRCRREAE